MKGLLFAAIVLMSLRTAADEFVNLTFDSPDLTGSLTPIFPGQPSGPFFGQASQLLRGWTFTSAGLSAQQSTYSPWPTSASERTLNLQANRPEEVGGPSGNFYLLFNSGDLALGPELRLSQTGMIPQDASGLRVFGNGRWFMQINGEVVGTELRNQAAPVDVSRFVGQTVQLEIVFPRGASGLFDIYGFTQIPEPSTWALFGVGALALGWTVRQRRS
jgi:PEP-CTERM motif